MVSLTGRKAVQFFQRSLDEALRSVHTREHVAMTSVKREKTPSCVQQHAAATDRELLYMYTRQIKHLMTGPKGNSEFCFPETLSFDSPRSRGNKTLYIKCFVIPANSKLEKKLRRNRLPYAGWLINLPRFQKTRTDHVRVESLSRCFPRGLVSFDPRQVRRFSPTGKHI